MTTSQTQAPAQSAGSGQVAYNLAGIAVLVLLLAVGVAYGIDQAGRTTQPGQPALGDGDPVVQTIAGRDLTIPSPWFRYGEQIKPGFASQADLRFNLALTPDQVLLPVDATLLPRSRARTSAALLDAVYLHQFADETLGGIPGLVGKPLQPVEGYAGETVWYDPLSPNPFVAKCANAPDASRPARCLRTVHLPGGLAAVLSFDATALAAWRRFDDEMAQWLGQIGAL